MQLYRTIKRASKKIVRGLVVCVAAGVLLTGGPAASAAPATGVIPAANTALEPVAVTGVRFSNAPGKVRIVLDANAPVVFTEVTEGNRIVLDVEAINCSGKQVFTSNDALVTGWQLTEPIKGKTRVAIDLSRKAVFRTFRLPGPNRLVIDIIKDYREKVEYDLAPGIRYTSWRESLRAGPLWLHLLTVDPRSGYTVRPVLARDAIANGREPLTQLLSRTGALAGINASYFDTTGWIIGNLKLDGEIASAEQQLRSAFSAFADGRYRVGQISYAGRIVLPDGGVLPIGGVNRPRLNDELVLFNHHYGDSTGMKSGVEVLVENGRVSAVNPQGNSRLTPGASVLSAHGQAARRLAGLKAGQRLVIQETLGGVEDQADYVLGAGPLLVSEGRLALATEAEAFGPDVAAGRAPRTAVGIGKNGEILLVVVDGRQWNSVGLTLLELAEFMQSLGAEAAMNLDGGGSSELVYRRDIMNTPSDGRERPVASALAVFPTGRP